MIFGLAIQTKADANEECEIAANMEGFLNKGLDPKLENKAFPAASAEVTWSGIKFIFIKVSDDSGTIFIKDELVEKLDKSIFPKPFRDYLEVYTVRISDGKLTQKDTEQAIQACLDAVKSLRSSRLTPTNSDER